MRDAAAFEGHYGQKHIHLKTLKKQRGHLRVNGETWASRRIKQNSIRRKNDMFQKYSRVEGQCRKYVRRMTQRTRTP